MNIQITKDQITRGYSISHNIRYHDEVKLDVPLEQRHGVGLEVSVEIDGISYAGILQPAIAQVQQQSEAA